ncbi:hypothetical protein XHV734_1728 [Xanthomonas hortorum pv. vitians]|nr:hypothetical protein XHV734_1728 [Xanthomonas hortorum pv. vitians]
MAVIEESDGLNPNVMNLWAESQAF